MERYPDGAFLPVDTESDRIKRAVLTEEAIERMSASDPDHPDFDDAFWVRKASEPSRFKRLGSRCDR